MEELTLDYNDIIRIQVNRTPYLMIDKATSVIPSKKAYGYKNLSFNEWFFPVHFPGDPCMPGYLQAEALTQMFALTLLTLEGNEGKIALLLYCDKLKLYQKVRPGDRLDLETELISYRHGLAKGNGKAYVDGKLVCSCEMVITLSDSEERKVLTPRI